MRSETVISHVLFKNYKALSYFSFALQQMNILVGPNNCGKSTIIGAFRILDIAIRRARAKKAEYYDGIYGHKLSAEVIPISLENVHTNYSEDDTTITFYLNNKNKLILNFLRNGNCIFSAESDKYGIIKTPSKFNTEFPISLTVVPVLGPVEHEEEQKTLDTIKKGLSTHRASLHFRNYWIYFPEDFDNFSKLIKKTWRGMTVERPYLVDAADTKLAMLCYEDRIAREIYWAGFGFQVWCQLLTHISRSKGSTIIVIDEPEIYLHPEVQRQLINILRDINIDVVIATHSTEMLGEADASEILFVNKYNRSAKRLKDIEGVQNAIQKIGSLQNITLTQLAKNRKTLFVEGANDYKILRRFAKKLGFVDLANGLDITAVESKGFSSWDKIKSFSWGFKTAFNENISVAAIFDRDYWCDEEIIKIEEELSKEINYVHLHRTKEIENYLLNPVILQRLSEKLLFEKEKRSGEKDNEKVNIVKILDEISQPQKTKNLAQYLSKRNQYFQKFTKQDESVLHQETLALFDKKWNNIKERMDIIHGKDTLASLREIVQDKYSITLTDFRIIDEYNVDEIPSTIISIIENLEKFRTT
jgi:predicted ATP-dependent endonuclease of OLD family